MVLPPGALFVVSVALSLQKILWVLAFKYLVVVMQHIAIVNFRKLGLHFAPPLKDVPFVLLERKRKGLVGCIHLQRMH